MKCYLFCINQTKSKVCFPQTLFGFWSIKKSNYDESNDIYYRALSIFWFATKHLEKVFYFTNGNWRIHSNSTLAICDKLNETDKRIFPFDMRNFDWEDCTAYYVRGVRVYVVNDPLDNIEVAKKHFRRLQFIHYTFVTVVGLLAAYYVFGWINCLINIFF